MSGSEPNGSAWTCSASRPTVARRPVRARVRRDVESGLRAGVADTLAIFRDGREVELAALEQAA